MASLSCTETLSHKLSVSWFVEVTCSLIPLVELSWKKQAFLLASGLTPLVQRPSEKGLYERSSNICKQASIPTDRGFSLAIEALESRPGTQAVTVGFWGAFRISVGELA